MTGFRQQGNAMPVLPVYHVEFVPSERRLNDRRQASEAVVLPSGVLHDRRVVQSRRADDHAATSLRLVNKTS
jgi:hypothetical protein